MKKLFLGLLIGFLATVGSQAQSILQLAGDANIGGGGGGVTYIFEEDAEVSGDVTGTGWTDIGSIDWGETGTVLEGSESIDVSGGSRTYYDLASGESVVEIYYAWRSPGTPATNTMMEIQDSGFSGLVKLVHRDSNIVQVRDESDTTHDSIGVSATAEDLHVRIRYEEGTGSDGKISVWIRSSPIWGVADVVVTTASSVGAALRFRFNAGTNIFDDVKVTSGDAIPDNP